MNFKDVKVGDYLELDWARIIPAKFEGNKPDIIQITGINLGRYQYNVFENNNNAQYYREGFTAESQMGRQCSPSSYVDKIEVGEPVTLSDDFNTLFG